MPLFYVPPFLSRKILRMHLEVGDHDVLAWLR